MGAGAHLLVCEQQCSGKGQWRPPLWLEMSLSLTVDSFACCSAAKGENKLYVGAEELCAPCARCQLTLFVVLAASEFKLCAARQSFATPAR